MYVNMLGFLIFSKNLLIEVVVSFTSRNITTSSFLSIIDVLIGLITVFNTLYFRLCEVFVKLFLITM